MNGAIASYGSAPSAVSLSCSRATWPSSAAAMVASAILSRMAGAILASSASRSNAEISPYEMAPSRSIDRLAVGRVLEVRRIARQEVRDLGCRHASNLPIG